VWVFPVFLLLWDFYPCWLPFAARASLGPGNEVRRLLFSESMVGSSPACFFFWFSPLDSSSLFGPVPAVKNRIVIRSSDCAWFLPVEDQSLHTAFSVLEDLYARPCLLVVPHYLVSVSFLRTCAFLSIPMLLPARSSRKAPFSFSFLEFSVSVFLLYVCLSLGIPVPPSKPLI